MFEGDSFALGGLMFQRHLPGNHHIAAPAVQLDNLDRNVLSGEGIEVAHRPDVDLGTRHKGLNPDIHRKAALDAADDSSEMVSCS